jgi:hypothetical protein
MLRELWHWVKRTYFFTAGAFRRGDYLLGLSGVVFFPVWVLLVYLVEGRGLGEKKP